MSFEGDALNDVVLSRGNETHLIAFDVYINQQFVSHYRSDGLILATPTGSTAYALSAGGPIMHPQINAIVMVPMFSHSLNSRPLVIDGQSIVEIRISESNENQLQISCDGHESSDVKPGQKVIIEKNSRQLQLLHPGDYHYYDTLRIKLGWGSHFQG
jgi:NAD+ kinase